MNKPLALAAAFLAACTTQATFLEGVPALAAGDDTFWVYYCDSGAELQMNYANMGGEYSATPNSKTASASCRGAAITTSATANTAGRATTAAATSASATASKPCTANAAAVANWTKTPFTCARGCLQFSELAPLPVGEGLG